MRVVTIVHDFAWIQYVESTVQYMVKFNNISFNKWTVRGTFIRCT